MTRRTTATIVTIITATVLLITIASPVLSSVLSRWVTPLSDGECEECHNGFEAFQAIPDVPKEVKRAWQFEYAFIIRNPWEHDLTDVTMTIDLSQAPTFYGPGRGHTSTYETGTVSAGSSTTHNLEVRDMATDLICNLSFDPPLYYRGDLNLVIVAPDGTMFGSDTSGDEEQIILSDEELSASGPGTYEIVVSNEGMVLPMDYSIETSVTYSDSVLVSDPVDIGPGEESRISFTLTAGEGGRNTVSYIISATAGHDHRGDQPDSDVYEVEGTTVITVGDAFVKSDPVSTLSKLESMWYLGRFLGFMTAALFTVSFLSGGTIVRLKRWIDGHVRTRQNWHCIISTLAVMSAIAHMTFLYLGPYGGTYNGSLLGGVATLGMISIGITGATRKRIADRIGDRQWRRLHLYLAIGVVLVFAIHAVSEGTDLAFLRFW